MAEAEGGGVEDVPKNVPFSDVPKNVPKNASSSSSSLYSSADADATRRALRLLLGAHPNAGAMDEVSRRFESPTNPRRAHPRYSREGRGAPRAPLERNPGPRAGLFGGPRRRRRRRGVGIHGDGGARVAGGCVYDRGDTRRRRRRVREHGERRKRANARARPRGERGMGRRTRSRGNEYARERGSHRGPAAAAAAAAGRGVPRGRGYRRRRAGLTGLTVVAPPPPRTPWPADAPLHVSFARIATASDTSTSVSVIGAVVRREPPSGTKSLKNPKTGRSYDMLFVTLADHTGARCRAQLIGKKARARGDVGAGGGRRGGDRRGTTRRRGGMRGDPAEKSDEHTDGGGGRRGVGPEGDVRPRRQPGTRGGEKIVTTRRADRRGECGCRGGRSTPSVRLRPFDSVRSTPSRGGRGRGGRRRDARRWRR